MFTNTEARSDRDKDAKDNCLYARGDGPLVEIITVHPSDCPDCDFSNIVVIQEHIEAAEPDHDTDLGSYMIQVIADTLKASHVDRNERQLWNDRIYGACQAIQNDLLAVQSTDEVVQPLKGVDEGFRVLRDAVESMPVDNWRDSLLRANWRNLLTAAEWEVTGKGTLTNEQKHIISAATEHYQAHFAPPDDIQPPSRGTQPNNSPEVWATRIKQFAFDPLLTLELAEALTHPSTTVGAAAFLCTVAFDEGVSYICHVPSVRTEVSSAAGYMWNVLAPGNTSKETSEAHKDEPIDLKDTDYEESYEGYSLAV